MCVVVKNVHICLVVNAYEWNCLCLQLVSVRYMSNADIIVWLHLAMAKIVVVGEDTMSLYIFIRSWCDLLAAVHGLVSVDVSTQDYQF